MGYLVGFPQLKHFPGFVVALVSSWSTHISFIGRVLEGYWDVILMPSLFLLAGWRVVNWWQRRTLEGKASFLLSGYDKCDGALSTGVGCAEVIGLGIGGHITKWSRNRKRGLAFSLANEAYYQFGHRVRSEANDMITRKFMRDLLREHKSIRARDASDIIDRALSLSYLPSSTLQEMSEIEGTTAYAVRSRLSSQRGWFDWISSRTS